MSHSAALGDNMFWAMFVKYYNAQLLQRIYYAFLKIWMWKINIFRMNWFRGESHKHSREVRK